MVDIDFSGFVQAIRQRRIEAPIIFLLESSKPMHGLLHQLCLAFRPLLAAICGAKSADGLLAISENPAHIEALICALENKSVGAETASVDQPR